MDDHKYHSSDHDHSNDHPGHEEKHGHTHGPIDPSILTSQRGIWAVKWSFIGLMITALFQIYVVWISNSIALLADTIHNFGDAATAIPLAIAFLFGRKKPSKRFTHGYGRVEDLAGVFVVLTIFVSAVIAGYQAIQRFIHPQTVDHLGAVMIASIVGFIGNEAVAIFRIKVGKEIQSAALIADGHHARVDGFTSLAVLLGAIGVYVGFPLADPIVGVLISIAIFKIVWDSAKTVFIRLLDGVEPEVVDEIRHAASHVSEVREITEVRARWIGHFIEAELNITVDTHLTVEQGHQIANKVRQELTSHLKYISTVSIHVDPVSASGDLHHRNLSHSV